MPIAKGSHVRGVFFRRFVEEMTFALPKAFALLTIRLLISLTTMGAIDSHLSSTTGIEPIRLRTPSGHHFSGIATRNGMTFLRVRT